MKGVFERYNMPIGEKRVINEAILNTFHFSEEKGRLYNMQNIMNGGYLFKVNTGNYVRLNVAGELMMTDTQMERNTNRHFIKKAQGHILIGGLGIGLLLHNIWDKMDSEDIKSITIIEKYQSVIDLVSPFFVHPKITVICADMLEWRPSKGSKYDCIYFDIWPTICTDNLKEISILHNRFKWFKNKDNPNVYMGSWMQEYLQDLQRRENRNKYW